MVVHKAKVGRPARSDPGVVAFGGAQHHVHTGGKLQLGVTTLLSKTAAAHSPAVQARFARNSAHVRACAELNRWAGSVGKEASMAERLSGYPGEARVGEVRANSSDLSPPITKKQALEASERAEALAGASEEAGADAALGTLPRVIEILRPSKSKESCVTESGSEAGVPIQRQPCRTLRVRDGRASPFAEDVLKPCRRVEREVEGNGQPKSSGQ